MREKILDSLKAKDPLDEILDILSEDSDSQNVENFKSEDNLKNKPKKLELLKKASLKPKLTNPNIKLTSNLEMSIKINYKNFTNEFDLDNNSDY